MAKKADSASVSDAIRPADFRGSVQLIRTIPALKEKIQSINGQIGEIWSRVDGKKVDKAAGKIFAKLDKLTPEDRVKTMRALNKLIDSAGWDESAADLVDIAENNVVAMNAGGRRAKPVPDLESGKGGDDDDKESDPPAVSIPLDASQQAAADAQLRNRGGSAVERLKTAKDTVAKHFGSEGTIQ